MATSQTPGVSRLPLEVRQLHTHEEFEQAVRLQRLIWGFEEIELLPVRLFVVASKVGGHAFGAFDGNMMVAFCLAIPGLKSGGGIYLHSHMLGVLKEYRDRGLGRILKLAQREEALPRGIRLIEWTFDPLELKNAYFNIERLGAVIRRFVLNQYGTTTSHLHGGLPTDRCVAEWYIADQRVTNLLAGGTLERRPVVARISFPNNIGELRKTDPKQARSIQEEASHQFLAYFNQGLEVTAFERSPDTGTYLFTEP
jgi:predicted GNAT superfamily acetyltransferase